jgi:hypothetical protein
MACDECAECEASSPGTSCSGLLVLISDEREFSISSWNPPFFMGIRSSDEHVALIWSTAGSRI